MSTFALVCFSVALVANVVSIYFLHKAHKLQKQLIDLYRKKEVVNTFTVDLGNIGPGESVIVNPPPRYPRPPMPHRPPRPVSPASRHVREDGTDTTGKQ